MCDFPYRARCSGYDPEEEGEGDFDCEEDVDLNENLLKAFDEGPCAGICEYSVVYK